MVKVTFLNSAGESQIFEATPGESLMEVAVINNIAGIEASCGGSCSCATCMVYVDEAWSAKLPPKSGIEAGMLVMSSQLRENSRLACQITLDPQYDGLVVLVPDQQL